MKELDEIRARAHKTLEVVNPDYFIFDAQRCLRADIPRLAGALERVLAEVKRSTDKAFYEHCVSKAESILNGDKP